MEQGTDQWRAFALSVAFHLGLAGLLWLGLVLRLPMSSEPAAGEPIQAQLQLSRADEARMQAILQEAEKIEPEPAPEPQPPQPEPAPAPQDSPVPPQETPQVQLDQPDVVDQDEVRAAAALQAEQRRIQEERRRQEQVELTQDLLRQEQAERRQRLREQQAEIQRQLEAARKKRQLEEQKLQQLADLRASAAARPAPTVDAAPPGERGADQGLLAQYLAAMRQTADNNWNHLGAPERVKCEVRFTQLPGGEVIKVEFIRCPYDEQGREFVDRALRKTPMPYSGYEKVFIRSPTITFCYPKEECDP